MPGMSLVQARDGNIARHNKLAANPGIPTSNVCSTEYKVGHTP